MTIIVNNVASHYQWERSKIARIKTTTASKIIGAKQYPNIDIVPITLTFEPIQIKFIARPKPIRKIIQINTGIIPALNLLVVEFALYAKNTMNDITSEYNTGPNTSHY